MFLRLTYMFCLALFSSHTFAADTWESVKDTAGDLGSSTSEELKRAINRDKDEKVRKSNNGTINVSLSPINIPFPMAWGVDGQYFVNEHWSIGGEYLSSSYAISIFSFEIGEITERKYLLEAKRFWTNSFHTTFGVGLRNTETKLAKNLFDLATHNYSETVSEFKTHFIKLGIGNQWHFKKKYTVGVDWLSLDIPFDGEVVKSAVEYAEDEEDRETIADAEDTLKYYPGFAAFKLHVGMVF